MDSEAKKWLCAQMAHEVNRAWCGIHGDHSHKPWAETPDDIKRSAYLGVEGALAGNTPAQSHESWLTNKLNDGWSYGLVKDGQLKQHPCMLPYEDLPGQQRAKDVLFISTVRATWDALAL